MPERELPSALIGCIYDAALDPTLWRGVLQKIAAYTGGQSAGLASMDSVSKAADAHYTFGCDPHYLQLQIDTYAKFDPTSALFLFAPGQVVSIGDLMPYDEYLETRFYLEWAQPQGWVDSASAVIDKSATSFAFFSVYRNEASGLVDDEMRRRMELIVPHIRRAVLIGNVIDLQRTEAAALVDTLDGLAAGIFLVDGQGRLVQANASGRGMLNQASVLHATGGRLVANDPKADEALRDAFAAAQDGDAALGARAIAVPLVASTGQRYVAHVLPLTSGMRRQAGTSAAAAAIFVRSAQLDTPAAPEVIAKLYGLTPSELRMLLAVFDLSRTQDIADALGISNATAKTHLRRLFEKTGTNRQADLVKLVAGFASPV
jgi:DNA-binding CsgD family transcriptional regulator